MKCRKCGKNDISYRVICEDETSVTGKSNTYICNKCFHKDDYSNTNMIYKCDKGGGILKTVK